MSGSLPAFFPVLEPLISEANVERPQIGVKPDYSDVKSIDVKRYFDLTKLPDAVLTTANFWEIRKFQYDLLFTILSESEKSEHWKLYRDNKRKVLNVESEFRMLVTTIESFSNFRWTIRGGGQDLRAKQLAEIRLIFGLLEVNTLHNNHEHVIRKDLFEKALGNVWKHRETLSKIFDLKFLMDNTGKLYR